MIPALDYRLPTAPHILNVKTGYGAIGDGVADDTQAFKNAILDGCKNQYYIFVPKGTYLISDQLSGSKPTTGYPDDNLKIFGENRDQTILKLANGAAGFGDKATPKPMLRFSSDSSSTHLTGWETSGEGNEAFGNYLEHLTIDTGNNPGAVGVDYLANNHGAVRDVVIRGNGYCGINMVRQWPGPCLLKHIFIEGFDYAARTSQYQYSVTFEHVEISGQQVAGLYNEKNQLTVRDLKSTNTVPSIVQNNQYGQITLIDADLGSTKIDLFIGDLFLRNITNLSSLNNKGVTVNGPSLAEWVSRPNLKQFSEASAASLNLPVAEPPEYHNNDMSTWANILDYGAVASGGSIDAAPGIQAAMNSGKETIYFPTNSYHLASTIRIPPTVKRVAGFGSSCYPKSASGFTDNPKPLFRCENSAPLVVERLRGAKNTEAVPGLVSLEQAGGTLYIKDGNFTSRDLVNPGFRTLPSATGPVFIENTVGTRFEFTNKAQKIYARTLNIETPALKLDIRGAHVYILGFKTENVGPVATLIDQARLELLGGFMYIAGTPAAGTTAFTSKYSTMSLNYIENSYADASSYPIHVAETSYTSGATSTRSLLKAGVPWRGWGHLVSLYTTVNAGDVSPPASYAIVSSDPLDVQVVSQDVTMTYMARFINQDRSELSTIKVTLLPTDTQATTLTKVQAALTLEATRLGMLLISANMFLPSVIKG